MITRFLFSASSLQCYNCVREDKPDADKYCEITNSSLGNNTIKNCTSGDNRCIITKTVKMDSVTQFRRDCGKQEGCTNKCTDPDAEGTVICDSCCEEDLCNKDSGPEPATPDPATPAATTIPATTDPTTQVTAAKKSGTSRIVMTRGLYALGGFLMWFVL